MAQKKGRGGGNLCTVRGTESSVPTGIFTHGPKCRKHYKGYDPAIPLLDIHLEKNIIRKDTCTPMSIEALFTIVKTWKQPKCPSTDEQIKKMW